MADLMQRFQPESLLASLRQAKLNGPFLIGLSGGADSVALLHAFSVANTHEPIEFEAIHFNHGLHENADTWQAHCQNLCDDLNIRLTAVKLTVSENEGNGPEDAARQARYKQLERLINPAQVFVTAHHQDDQAETVLLHLMRASGVDGLSGMPVSRQLGKGTLFRPLLGFSRASLENYLIRNQVQWVDDPSNEDTRFDRNFVRQNVIPLLETRWPTVRKQIAQSAVHCRTASKMLQATTMDRLGLDQNDTPRVIDMSLLCPGTQDFSLLLRQWVRTCGSTSIPAKRIAELERQLLTSEPQGHVQVDWDQWEIRSFQGMLWLSEVNSVPHLDLCHWTEPGKLELGDGLGSIEFRRCNQLPEGILDIRSRQGGERIRCMRTGQHRRIKDVIREAGVPPWLRQALPIVLLESEPVAVADLVISESLQHWTDSHKTSLRWLPSDPMLRLVQKRYMVDRQPPLR